MEKKTRTTRLMKMNSCKIIIFILAFDTNSLLYLTVRTIDRSGRECPNPSTGRKILPYHPVTVLAGHRVGEMLPTLNIIKCSVKKPDLSSTRNLQKEAGYGCCTDNSVHSVHAWRYAVRTYIIYMAGSSYMNA